MEVLLQELALTCLGRRVVVGARGELGVVLLQVLPLLEEPTDLARSEFLMDNVKSQFLLLSTLSEHFQIGEGKTNQSLLCSKRHEQ